MYNTTPFDILDRDAENVIMVINYVLEKNADARPENSSGGGSNLAKRAKDNFWDF